MVEAIIGLVGVVLGGALGGGVQYAMARREEKADRRAAARLVSGELLLNYTHLAMAVKSRRWYPLSRNRTVRFTEFEPLLARMLPGEDERAVGSAYLMLETAAIAASQAEQNGEMSLADWQVAVAALNAARQGLDALICHTDMPAAGPDVAQPLGLHPDLERDR